MISSRDVIEVNMREPTYSLLFMLFVYGGKTNCAPKVVQSCSLDVCLKGTMRRKKAVQLSLLFHGP